MWNSSPWVTRADEATEVGPIIHTRQVERVHGFVQRAVADGATLLWGGAHILTRQYKD